MTDYFRTQRTTLNYKKNRTPSDKMGYPHPTNQSEYSSLIDSQALDTSPWISNSNSSPAAAADPTLFSNVWEELNLQSPPEDKRTDIVQDIEEDEERCRPAKLCQGSGPFKSNFFPGPRT